MINDIKYRFDETELQIAEFANENDIEFRIFIAEEGHGLERIRRVQSHFEQDQVYTNALFYPLADHEYRIIVKRSFYVDFLLQMFRHRLLVTVEWRTIGRETGER